MTEQNTTITLSIETYDKLNSFKEKKCMKNKEPQTTALTRDPILRAEFIELLKTGMGMGEIASLMGINRCMAKQTLSRLLWETAFQLANEDEIAKLWSCVLALSKRLAELEERKG